MQAVIWQGFHHEWEYNHRVNRLGSYVRHANGGPPVAGHTAASGTGADVAHFTEFATRVQAQGVAFIPGQASTVVECPRNNDTPFVIKVSDLPLPAQARGKDQYTVILNGFDLYAQDHADKLISFALEVTDPIVYQGGQKLRFSMVGSLRFDCRSPECQLLPLGLDIEEVDPEKREQEPVHQVEPVRRKRGIEKHRLDSAVQWIKQQLVRLTNLDDVKESIIGKDEDALRRWLFRAFGRRFFLKMLKWRITTPYVLVAHYIVIAGDGDALHTAESDLIENDYAWNMQDEIHRADCGIVPVEVTGEPDRAASTLGFRQIALTVTLDEEQGTSDPIQWGKGMHFLAWSTAIRDITVEGGKVRANLDLFYKCWSEAMNEVITLTTWGAFRAAGRAEFAARLALLQFTEGEVSPQAALPGRIRWPGGGLSAKRHPQAIYERPATPDE
ncbi:MAG: hypothetical protein GYB64_02795 [Chloroflexi bacterium]|nr:hypothetical protein [Chloroflexota bacterium]